MSNELEIRKFNVREANWSLDKSTLSNLRKLVFIVEQHVPQEEEWDGKDDDAWHWLATDIEDRPIGTARLLPNGQIGRMAVLKEYRGWHVGSALLEQAVEKARHLGFESVFLNAQSHALDFYRRGGFVEEGEEFMEAGIPHFRMQQTLSPAGGNTQRKPITGEIPDVSIREDDTAEVSWQTGQKIIRSLRKSILVSELGLPDDLLEDELDTTAIHFHTQTPDGQTIAAMRMDLAGNISRLAVDAGHRGRGTGNALLEAALRKAQRFGFKEIKLDGLSALDGFYRQAGFEPYGEPYVAHGHEHQPYRREISYGELLEPPIETRSGEAYSDAPYLLGESNIFLLIRREEEFRRVIQEMCRQATHSIRILSPMLDHKLFDTEELRDVFSALARKNRYTSIEILLYDSHRVVKNGHHLLEIARKLPSSINFKIVHPELRTLNHQYILVDGAGVIYCQDYEDYEGYANFKDVTENNRLGRQFRRSWESGLYDPNLRQLKI